MCCAPGSKGCGLRAFVPRRAARAAGCARTSPAGHQVNFVLSYAVCCPMQVIKGNFVLIYELLDEVLDHGYPQVNTVEFKPPI